MLKLGSTTLNRLNFGTGNAKKVYLGSNLIYNKSGPWMTADFTTQTYSVNGVSKVFSDLFATARAGTTATYTDVAGATQTAAANTPRFDWNPTTHAPLGILSEGGATNFLLNSGVPVTQTTGSLSVRAYTLWVLGSGSATVAAGTAVGTGFGTATAGTPVVFNVTTGGTVIVTVSGSLTRFQLENNIFPTSYVPTTAATATRNSETTINSTLSNIGFNATEGTLLVEFMTEWDSANGSVFAGIGEFNNGTTTNRMTVFHTNTVAKSLRNEDTPSPSFNIDASILANGANVVQKVARAYKTANHALCVNGGTVVTSSANGVVASLSQLNVGSSLQRGQLGGWVRKISYYQERRINSELQTITT